LAPETPKEKIEKMKSDLEETKKRIPNIFEECMKALVYPSFTQRLANALNNKGEYELTIKASEACLVLIPNLVQKAKDKYEIQRDLNEIEEEFRELQSLKPPQQLSPEKIQKRRELSLILEFNRIQSSDMALTPLQLIEYYSSVPSLMFTSLQNQQQTRIQKLDQIVHFISTPFDNISETAIGLNFFLIYFDFFLNFDFIYDLHFEILIFFFFFFFDNSRSSSSNSIKERRKT